jgi:branched-subunit amino acid aminotransferase/4-amino-4-deoxychorismate lyase
VGRPPETLLAADSWLVENGRARGLAAHRARFLDACVAAGRSRAEVAAFWATALARLPGHGCLFPRVELTDDGLNLRLRPAPPRGGPLRLAVRRDGRRDARHKGPDLAWLTAVRDAADADDAVLLGVDGVVLETTTAALIWWDGDRLAFVDPALPVLPSVTAGLIRDAALARGIPVEHRNARLADLDGCEIWAANALHGIRPVTAFPGRGVTPGAAVRAAGWQRWWDGLAEKVS